MALADVLLISLLCSVPDRAVSTRIIGFCLVLVTLTSMGFSVTLVWQTLIKNRRTGVGAGRGRRFKEAEYLARALVNNLSLLLAFLAGASLWRGNPDGANWLVPSFVLMGALALNNSWSLVLRVDE